jgi:hypothetical protein
MLGLRVGSQGSSNSINSKRDENSGTFTAVGVRDWALNHVDRRFATHLLIKTGSK